MKAIRMETDKNRICIQNLKRIEESELFLEAADKLRKGGVSLKQKKEYPYSVEMEGDIGGAAFQLVLDEDYGAELYCESDQGLEGLITILNS